MTERLAQPVDPIRLARLLHGRGAPRAALLCYLALAESADGDGLASLTYEALEQRIGLRARSVGLGLSHLRRLGLIRRTERRIWLGPWQYRVVPLEEVEGREVGE